MVVERTTHVGMKWLETREVADAGYPSRKYVLPDILDLFQGRRESGVLGHCRCRRGSRTTKPIVCALLLLVTTVIRSRVSLQLEIVALRHQLTVYQRTTKRPQISSGDLHHHYERLAA